MGVGVTFIPVNGEPPGIVTLGLLTFVLGFVLCALLLNVPFFATGEHRALEQKLGMPLCVIYTAFFGLISTYVSLTRLNSLPLARTLRHCPSVPEVLLRAEASVVGTASIDAKGRPRKRVGQAGER